MTRFITYHGYPMKALAPHLMAEAEIIEIPDERSGLQAVSERSPIPVSAPIQMPLMTLTGAGAKRRGHAHRPGTGPAGQTCGTCSSYCRIRRNLRLYSKCERNKANWSRGQGSDIRRRDPACMFWSAKA